MKRLLITFVISAYALTLPAQGVSGGIKAGANFANLSFSSGSSTFTPDGITSYHAGLFLTAMFSEKIGIQPEAIYSSQGAKFNVSGFTAEDKLTYINVPVLFRYNIVPVINIQVGPQFGFLMSAQETSGGVTQDIKNDLKSVEFSGAAGLGFDLPMGLGGGARYVFGLSNINDDSSSSTTVKNNVFQLYLSFRLFGAGD